MKLQGKVAVITGGSRGIGFSIAEEFHREGAKIALFARNKENLAKAEMMLKDHTMSVAGDVTSLEDLDHLYQSSYANFGPIDVVVANAGIYQSSELSCMTEKKYYEIMDTNLKGAFFTVQRALSFLSEGASIILIASTSGHRGVKGSSLYNASKAAVINLASSFAADLVSKKMRVNSISAGMVRSELLMSAAPVETIACWEKEVPMQRIAHPREIAKAALFLASDDSSYMTGADLVVDGGLVHLNL